MIELSKCRACGRIRGDLSELCASCIKERTQDIYSRGNITESDRYRMEDTVKQADRERGESIKASFRRGP